MQRCTFICSLGFTVVDHNALLLFFSSSFKNVFKISLRTRPSKAAIHFGSCLRFGGSGVFVWACLMQSREATQSWLYAYISVCTRGAWFCLQTSPRFNFLTLSFFSHFVLIAYSARFKGAVIIFTLRNSRTCCTLLFELWAVRPTVITSCLQNLLA